MTDKLQEVRDFLDSAAKTKGLSLNSLSLQLGKNSTYLFHFIKRHSPKRLDEPTRRKLAQILSVPEQRLCDYPINGSLIQDKLSTITGLLGLGKEKDNCFSIEVVDVQGIHRGRFEDVKSNIIGVENLSAEMVRHYGFNNPSLIKILKNIGDAMAPSITSNDMIWVDTSYNNVTGDGIYVINTNNDMIIRRLQVNPLNNSLELSADNPIYKSFELKNAKDIEICGKVLWVMHKI